MMPPIAEWGGDMHLEGHEPHETVFDIFADGSQSLYEYPAPSSRCYRVSASFSQLRHPLEALERHACGGATQGPLGQGSPEML